MPGWKRDVGRRLDEIVVAAVPEVCKAVKWNSPFYGVEAGRWFLSFHCFEKYIKVTFFDGASLDPVPPETSKYENVKYAHLREGEAIDGKLWMRWVKQASKLPGETL